MSDDLKHECGVALLRLRKGASFYRDKYGTSDFGGVKLSLLLEKQHNRGQDGAGAAMLRLQPESGSFVIFRIHIILARAASVVMS